MKKLIFIVIVILSTSCKKEVVTPVAPSTSCEVDTSFISSTKDKLVGEWKRTHERVLWQEWIESPFIFEVTSTHFRGHAYEVIAQDVIQLEDGSILRLFFTQDYTICTYDEQYFEMWQL